MFPSVSIIFHESLALYATSDKCCQICETKTYALTSSLLSDRLSRYTVDDRFDPYPTKRRAVSPSISHLRDSHSNMGSPRSGRLPIAIPVPVPSSAMSSAASSPTMAGGQYSRPMNITSSPTLRASMGLASPILRPLMRARRDDRDDREIDGAGEAVGGLSLA